MKDTYTYTDGICAGLEEAIMALECRASTIEQAEKAALEPGKIYCSAEVNALKSAAAMLRQILAEKDWTPLT